MFQTRSLHLLALGAVLAMPLSASPALLNSAAAQIVLRETRTHFGPRYTRSDLERMRESNRLIQQRTRERSIALRRAHQERQRTLERIRRQGPSITFGGNRPRSVSRGGSAVQR